MAMLDSDVLCRPDEPAPLSPRPQKRREANGLDRADVQRVIDRAAQARDRRRAR